MDPTPDQARAWHALFASAPLPALLEATTSRALPGPCLVDGRDVLFSLLARPELSADTASQWWGAVYGDRNRPVDQELAVLAHALLDLGCDPFRPSDHEPAPAQVHALELALAGNLVAVAARICQHARATGLSRELVGHLDAPATTSQALPLVHACAASDRLRLVALLDENGADLAAVDGTTRTALFHARTPGMARLLLDRGCPPQACAPGPTLAQHWLEQAGKVKGGGQWLGMMALLDDCAQPRTGADIQAGAVRWLADAHLSANPSGYGRAGATRAQWDTGWIAHLQPALEHAPIHAWQAQEASGPMRGTLTVAGALGWRWLSEAHSFSVHLALLDPAHPVLGPSPTPIRKGLDDWGVFALGATRHLAQSLPQSQHDPEALGLVMESRKRATAALEAMGSVERRQERMMAAAAVLTRPRDTTLWRKVSQAWTAHLATHYPDSRSLPPNAASSARQGLALAARAVEQGVRWLSSKNSMALLVGWIRALDNDASGWDADSRHDFLVASACMLADSRTFLAHANQRDLSWCTPAALEIHAKTALERILQARQGLARPFPPVVLDKLPAIVESKAAPAARLEQLLAASAQWQLDAVLAPSTSPRRSARL